MPRRLDPSRELPAPALGRADRAAMEWLIAVRHHAFERLLDPDPDIGPLRALAAEAPEGAGLDLRHRGATLLEELCALGLIPAAGALLSLGADPFAKSRAAPGLSAPLSLLEGSAFRRDDAPGLLSRMLAFAPDPESPQAAALLAAAAKAFSILRPPPGGRPPSAAVIELLFRGHDRPPFALAERVLLAFGPRHRLSLAAVEGVDPGAALAAMPNLARALEALAAADAIGAALPPPSPARGPDAKGAPARL